jgi:hypothetical protein
LAIFSNSFGGRRRESLDLNASVVQPYDLAVLVLLNILWECRCRSQRLHYDGRAQRTAAAGLRPPPLPVL